MSEAVKFSTRVKLPDGATRFSKIGHYNVSGTSPGRTSVIRFHGQWWVTLENPNKPDSFVMGGKAKASQVPTVAKYEPAPKAKTTVKKATAKKTTAKKSASKPKKVTKASAKKRARKAPAKPETSEDSGSLEVEAA